MHRNALKKDGWKNKIKSLEKNMTKKKNTFSKFVSQLSYFYSPKDLNMNKLKKKSERFIKDMIKKCKFRQS